MNAWRKQNTRKTIKNLSLIGILAIAFGYRFALMTMNVFPPGGDIGLHESVIKSITSGQTNFFWNNYHMGGGLSVTNPGYHIFTAFIISITGLSDYLAQPLVASLFSALTVACAFLITKRIWNESAAFIVAILATFSIGDIYMLSWGGYPNIITLMLIPTVFYLFLQPSSLFSKKYLVVTSILVSAIFLTHVFSAFIFVGITIAALFVCVVFRKYTGLLKKQVVFWLMPLVFGILLVAPYLVHNIPVYFSSEGTITGAVSQTTQAVLQTRLIPLEIIGLSMISVFVFFILFRLRSGKFLSINSVLLASWVIVPVLATQSYIFGLYLDFERFLYFLALPVVVCVGLVIASVFNALSQAPKNASSANVKIGEKSASGRAKKIATTLLVSLLVVGVLFTPLFALPNEGISQVNYFQVMNSSQYQAIQWIKTNTAIGSVFVADGEFGWWLSGFAQRPTLSAILPQYLILNHEVSVATMATNLLEADYSVDNGLIQIKQDGAYANGNSHEILGIFNDTYIHPPVLSINDTQISMLYRKNNSPEQFRLTELTQTSTKVKSNTDNTSFTISRVNKLFSITEVITIFRGVSFAEISFILENKTGGVSFDWLQLPFQSRGFPIQYDNSIAIVDGTLHQLNQIIFPFSKLGNDVMMQQNPDSYALIYNLHGYSAVKVSFFVGTCQFNPNLNIKQVDELNSLIENGSTSYLNKISNQPLNSFDYQAEMTQWNVSYVVVLDPKSIPRFTDDPTFALVFKNDQVSIFKVIKQNANPK